MTAPVTLSPDQVRALDCLIDALIAFRNAIDGDAELEHDDAEADQTGPLYGGGEISAA